MHRETPVGVEGVQLYQKETPAKVFPVNIAEFSRTPSLKNIYEKFQNRFCNEVCL